MAKDPKTRVFINDGVGRVSPLNEGRVERGGVNATNGGFDRRPPAPAALKPATSSNGGTPGASGSNTDKPNS